MYIYSSRSFFFFWTHTPLASSHMASKNMPSFERIDRAAGRLASHPNAVDILYASLAKALANPTVERYRKVNTENHVFKATVANKPGGIAGATQYRYRQS